MIFSYATALYFHGLSDRIPNTIHITLPHVYNATHIKKNIHIVHIHYINKEYFTIGIEEIQSPQGGYIKVYDKERCVYDIIRDKKNVDMQVFQRAIKDYFMSSNSNL